MIPKKFFFSLPLVNPGAGDKVVGVHYVNGQPQDALFPASAPPGVVLLGSLKGANMNIDTDQLITLTGGTKFIITDILIANASGTLVNTADGEFWDGAGRTGNHQASANFIHNITGPTKFQNASNGQLTIVATDYSAPTLYFSLGTPQGNTATADIYVYGTIIG